MRYQRPRGSLAVPGLILAITAGALITALAGVGGGLRTALVFAFIIACPGVAVVRLLRIPDRIAEATIGIALSLALSGTVAAVMAYTTWWVPEAGLVVLAALTVVATALELIREPASTPLDVVTLDPPPPGATS
jgi:uncharacterized membrane protein